MPPLPPPFLCLYVGGREVVIVIVMSHYVTYQLDFFFEPPPRVRTVHCDYVELHRSGVVSVHSLPDDTENKGVEVRPRHLPPSPNL